MDCPEAFDRAGHLREDLDRLEQIMDAPGTRVLCLHRGTVPMTPDGDRLVFAPAAARATALREAAELVFLGLLENQAVFAADLSPTSPQDLDALLGPHRLADLRMAMAALPAVEAHLAAYARAMFHFHSTHRHCGRCGSPTRPRKGGHTRICGGCETEIFPRTDPAVLVLVHHEGRLLLGRQHGWPRGMYSTLAGFVEPGESLEDAVRREVLEETGLQLRSVVYQRSQPWPFPGSLMLGFIAEATSDRITLDDELEDARFFTVDQVRSPAAHDFFVPGPHYLAGQVISAFLSTRSG